MNQITQDDLRYFVEQLGEENVSTAAEDLRTYGKDWTNAFVARPSAVVFPRSTPQVSNILRYCSAKMLAVVPSGGRTGLAAGAVATNGEVVLSLARMNKIERIDVVGLTATVEAGVTTEELKAAADAHDLFFALDLASKGSSQLGGNVATNAGGLKLIRYGGMRQLVLGLEVVLANGDVLDMTTPLIKDNTGYDLKHLFIGSEGTLGVVTRVTVKLSTKPKHYALMCLAVPSFAKIAQILTNCHALSVTPSAFEYMTAEAVELVRQFHPALRVPFSERTPYVVLLETEETRSNLESSQAVLEKLFEAELITDGVLASSTAEFANFWALRENISESCSNVGRMYKNDISVALMDLESFVSELETIAKRWHSKLRVIHFGHIGDGNVHINYLAPLSTEVTEFKALCAQAQAEVFALLKKYKGSISAEHGIGLLKKQELLESKPAAELELMKGLKLFFDPGNILNPGKIFSGLGV